MTTKLTAFQLFSRVDDMVEKDLARLLNMSDLAAARRVAGRVIGALASLALWEEAEILLETMKTAKKPIDIASEVECILADLEMNAEEAKE